MYLLLSTILIFILELCRQCYWGFFQFIGVILKTYMGPSWIYIYFVHGEVYLIQHYVIKFVSDLRQVLSTPVSSTNKTDRRDIAEISLKVALNTITLILKYNYKQTFQLN